MIESTSMRKQQAEARISLRSSVSEFEQIIAQGTNCSRFESEIISEKAQEVFHLGDYAHINRPQAGQIIWRVISSDEPPGKPLKECLYKEVLLSFHNFNDDLSVKKGYGLPARG